MVSNAMEETFDIVEILGMKALFTCMRIKRATVPNGLFTYDVRHDDKCSGEIVEIKPHIMVNHWGTIICQQPIELLDNECRFVDNTDYRYTGDTCKLHEFFDI